MKSIQVIFIILLVQELWHCDGLSTYDGRQINLNQKNIIEGCMDLKVNPCDDFYQYACGNWGQVFYEAGTNYNEPIDMMDYYVNMEMAMVFNSFSLQNKPKFIQEAYKYFKSCRAIKEYEPFNYLANNLLKSSALLVTHKRNIIYDWVRTLAQMSTYGLNDVFLRQIVTAKINETKSFIIQLDKPLINGGFKPMTKVNFNYVMNSVPASITTEDLETSWLEIEKFEEKLQQLDKIADVEVKTVEDYLRERQIYVKDLPLDWLKDYLKIILNQTELNPQMQLYVENIPYMKSLDELLKQYTQKFLCKYLEIRFLWHLNLEGPVNFLDAGCLSSTRRLMSNAMHWLYEQHHPELAQEYTAIYEIFNNVRKHFNETLIKNNYGFNATFIQYLQNKLSNMKLRLNNIPRIDTIAKLEEFYQSLSLDPEKFYENHLQLIRFNFQALINLLSSQTQILDSTYLENRVTGSSSSTFFVRRANIAFVPLTLLEQPFYSPALDDVYKYSTLGFLLAHEMFHGFDEIGLLTDANGITRLIEFDENPLFNLSYNCLRNINPLVVNEKIADISGLRYSYQAFFDANPDALTKTCNINDKEIPLIRVFFLNFAQFFCGTASTQEFSSMSIHGSDRERIMDALKHFPEFSKAFGCNRHQRLYAQDVCHLW
ncbi:membrane metallo-endopeptidase-like 1 [Calliphora vicina]|uniref:membrane metallo-endopeptidase-like 1 n=1 Tax=Calliphora vicina TaxID=7373 RepID=UPI00325BA95E